MKVEFLRHLFQFLKKGKSLSVATLRQSMRELNLQFRCENNSKGDRKGFLSPPSHITQHAGPHWAITKSAGP